jgi:CDP-diacylglycerol--glycerol-3-phosphate 3-phosphatidyltransferase
MKLADKITALRLVIAPVFYALYMLPDWFPASIGLLPGAAVWTVPALWVLFAAAELTDLVDGRVARARGESSDFGKLFDPFADILMHITFFLAFVVDGILPAPLLLVVLWREFSIQFMRNLMLRRGVTQGARWGGKIKTVCYFITCAAALLAVSAARLGAPQGFVSGTKAAALAVFGLSCLLAITSFFDYYNCYKKAGGGGSDGIVK